MSETDDLKWLKKKQRNLMAELQRINNKIQKLENPEPEPVKEETEDPVEEKKAEKPKKQKNKKKE